MYHIYSPEKHKVYRVGAARVEDGEGLDDPHDEPCLEDRVPTSDVEISNARSNDIQEIPDSEGSIRHPHQYSGVSEPPSDSEPEESSNDIRIEDCDDERDESDAEGTGPEVRSKYFGQLRHAGMAKRKTVDDAIRAPKTSRKATHDQVDSDQNGMSSEQSDIEDDSWYYSDDGKISRTYWDFVAKHGNRRMKNYLPDDKKCDRCFRTVRNCDLETTGIPCSNCRNEKMLCRTQSRETKRLVLPENRHRVKEIKYGSLQDPPCRLCFQLGNACYLSGSSGSRCEGCKKLNRLCKWNLEGAKADTARVNRKRRDMQARREKLGFTPVPRDQKCQRCASRVWACDGKYPCIRCNTEQLCLSCRQQGLGDSPPCAQCSLRSGRSCNRGRPCSRCIKQKINCT